MGNEPLRTPTKEIDDDAEYFDVIERDGWVILEGDNGFTVDKVRVWKYKGHDDDEWTDTQKGYAGSSMNVYPCDIHYSDNEDIDDIVTVVYFDRNRAYDRAIEFQNEVVSRYATGLNELRRGKRKRD